MESNKNPGPGRYELRTTLVDEKKRTMPSKYKGIEQDEIPGVGRYNVEKLPINKPP